MPPFTWTPREHHPPKWDQWVRACGGGIFHMPVSQLLSDQTGTPVYWHLTSPSGDTLGVALERRSGCKLALRPRHASFDSPPALAPHVEPAAALAALRDALRDDGTAHADVGSFDATYPLPEGGTPRLEYVLPISPNTDVTGRMGSTHKRHVRRGDREGWTTRLLTGAEALDAVLGVQRSTAERAASLARGFEAAAVTRWADAVVPALPLPASGLVAVGAYAYNEGALLAAVLVGWAGERAFYLIGGSTPDGYKCGAAPWLHVQVIRMLVPHGIRTYNLGGTPADAASESSPAHGLYRFKTGFGVEPVERRGIHWTFDAQHAMLHRAVDRLRGRG